MASCCCWVSYRRWLDRPLVCRFLLGVADFNNNIRNNRMLHRGPQVLHHQGFRVLNRNWCHPSLCWPELLRRISEVFFFPELHYLHYTASLPNNNVNTYILTKGAEYYTTQGAEYYTTQGAEYYTTQGAEYYTTQWAEYYTKAPVYFTTTYSASKYYTTKGIRVEAPKAHLCPELLHH